MANIFSRSLIRQSPRICSNYCYSARPFHSIISTSNSAHCRNNRINGNKIDSSVPSLTLKRYKFHNYHGEGRTSVTILNTEEGAPLMINSYSQTGFRLNNGHAVIGAIAIFPKTVLSWKVNDYKEINLDTLSLFFTLEPKLDLLIIGIGEPTSTVDAAFIRNIRNKGINVEVLTTEHACSTFNFLNMEKRKVAAALIPPRVVKFIDDDITNTQISKRNLFRDQQEDKIDDLINAPTPPLPRAGTKNNALNVLKDMIQERSERKRPAKSKPKKPEEPKD